MGKIMYNGDLVALVKKGIVTSPTYSLANSCYIGTSATNKVPSPIDANNYIAISGTTVTLKRNVYSYHLWVCTPVMLETGKTYAIVFDSITNSDGSFYVEKASDITTNPIVTTRFDTVGHTSTVTNGIVIKPDTTAYYGIAIWKNNTSDIVVSNPLLIECNDEEILVTKSITTNGTYNAENDNASGYSSVIVDVAGGITIKLNSGKLNASGQVVADSNYYYTDEIEFPNGSMVFDFGATNVSNTGVFMYKADSTFVDYYSPSQRYRVVNATSFYTQGVRKMRLSISKTYLSSVFLLDYVNEKMYSGTSNLYCMRIADNE